jgi:UDP-N-acetylmuramate: L-alanyl-gamma-D-glutamyl-meso-diaminopimelate ligase
VKPRKNSIPENVKKIHIVAICGTGMGALACMLKDQGFEITGSDDKVYPPMSEFLYSKGININKGFNSENLSYRPDLVIIGNAVGKDNPEAAAAMNLELNYCSMPQALNKFIAHGKKAILATGTHGKTTTSSIIAWILYKAGLDPSFMIGGILKNFSSNYRLGNGNYIVIEGDEYDTAFFDKGAKFLHYEPALAVLTSVEFDHADIFHDLDHVKSVFNTFISGLSNNSTIFGYDEDENITELFINKKCKTQRYGLRKDSGWLISDINISPPWNKFSVKKHGKIFGTFKTKMMGAHNLLNILSAIAVCDSLSLPLEILQKALETFENVKRRQEVRGVKNNITIMDDFAHHPTAVRETINAVKPFYPEGRLISVFEPRTNSSMRNVFQDIYPLSFDRADLICIRQPSLLEKIPQEIRFSSEKLVADLKKKDKDAHYFQDTDSIIDFLVSEAKPGDLVLVMSNGGFDNIHERLLGLL